MITKNTILSIFMLLLFSLGFSQEKVLIKGQLEHLEGHAVAISYSKDGQRITDTISSRDGYFEAVLPITELQEITLSPYRYLKNAILPKGNKSYRVPPRLVFLASPGDRLYVRGDAMQIWTSAVEGGVYSSDFQQLQSILVPLQTASWRLAYRHQELLNEEDREAANSIQEQKNVLDREQRDLLKQFYMQNTENIYSVYYLLKDKGHFQPEQLEQIYNTYSTALQVSLFGQELKSFIQRNKELGQGQEIPAFQALALDGSTFDSTALHGKYVLLDFWGSWCVPCRNSHPHLLALYNTYKDKGLVIVGIAHERGTDKLTTWKKAIQEDGINWIHVLNKARAEDQDLLKLYNIASFPTKILVDKEGAIIWKGVGTAAAGLDQKLEQLFK